MIYSIIVGLEDKPIVEIKNTNEEKNFEFLM